MELGLSPDNTTVHANAGLSGYYDQHKPINGLCNHTEEKIRIRSLVIEFWSWDCDFRGSASPININRKNRVSGETEFSWAFNPNSYLLRSHTSLSGLIGQIGELVRFYGHGRSSIHQREYRGTHYP